MSLLISSLPKPHSMYLSFAARTTLLVLIVALSACGGSDDDTPSSNPNLPDIPSNPTPEVDTNWLPAGGVATISSDISRPFLQIIPTLPTSSLGNISAGRELFITQWTPAGEGRVLFDGVGPIFNANACTQCHSSEGRQPTYAPNGEMRDAILFRLGNKQGIAHPYYGEQMQHQSIDSSVATEGKMLYDVITAVDSPLSTVSFSFIPTDSNQPLGDSAISGRISPQLVGMGMLNLIPNVDIIAAADADDVNEDSISGRVHWVIEGSQQQIGRFGWKAINSSLRIQNANAMSQDMGLTTSVFAEPNCTVSQFICKTLPNGGFAGGPEVIDESLDAVTEFMTALAVPERRIGNLQTFNQGATLFAQTGCAGCHTPKQKTGDSLRFPLLSQQTIYPYTDLLLHDMGTGLDDGVKEKNAESYEWRTPPLWGIGIVARDPEARFLHDGRASSLTEAILWHGGEAESTKNRFEQLPDDEKQILLTFLNGI
ncbi:di-heme oxidoredictase family protein [Psychrobacter sp. M13]|uniref:di-heme oxidoredictase family protein n=1 Tax=Psychrobacter sp. M13 TaxID=3067275 RepID=UPI00273AF64D|nr:di-heme oxidoredictase family protein [Psychrobacter sp. M13]WLP93603.1 di-heme oxidoredictase family protein [Psychrobacter sp. M13]